MNRHVLRGVVGMLVFTFLAYGGIASAVADELSTQDYIDQLQPQVKTRGLNVQPGTDSGTATQTEPAHVDMRVQFEFGSAELTAAAKAELGKLGAALQSEELSSFRFSLVGHTDAVGSDAANLNLSRARAKSVRDYLVGEFDIDPSRLKASGMGEADLYDPADPSNALNRRVVITNLGA